MFLIQLPKVHLNLTSLQMIRPQNPITHMNSRLLEILRLIIPRLSTLQLRLYTVQVYMQGVKRTQMMVQVLQRRLKSCLLFLLLAFHAVALGQHALKKDVF